MTSSGAPSDASPGADVGPDPATGTRSRFGLLRWWRAHPLTVDAIWAAGMLLVGAGLIVAGGLPGSPVREQLLVSVALAVPLVWRRRAPELVTGVVAVLQYLQLAVGVHQVLPANLFATVSVLFTVTAYGRDRVWQTFLGLALLGCVPVAAVVNLSVAVVTATTMIGATLAGYLRRIVRVRDEAAVERARRLEVERDSAATVAAEQERRRIARDLHDVIAHSLTVIVAQADGGRYAARTDPEAAQRSLETVASTARVALTDLRAALGALRAPGHADTTPLPGAVDVPSLVASVRDSGHPVVLTVTGEPGTVPPAAGLTAYRVVQESLTNVLKHAGPGVRTTVELHHEPTAVRVEVGDDGIGSASRTTAPDGSGTGLVGMRERVEAMGGRFQAGPREGGGWRVVADLPLQTGGLG
ncbi:sensor histidine kinase [Aquipuribacter sp. MA13-6]|uniref:sensor histidine kinase n=1 Tax=unclassified Aquipuribacter TaxID=2635084 RepID=UPI003EE829F1